MDTQLGYGRARIRTQAIQVQRVLNQPHGRSAPAKWRLRCPPLKGWRPQSECGQDHEPVLPAGSVPGCLSRCTLWATKEIFGRNVGHVQFLLCAPTSEAHPWVRLGLLGAQSGMTHKCRAASSEHTSRAQENMHSKWRPHIGAGDLGGVLHLQVENQNVKLNLHTKLSDTAARPLGPIR